MRKFLPSARPGSGRRARRSTSPSNRAPTGEKARHAPTPSWRRASIGWFTDSPTPIRWWPDKGSLRLREAGVEVAASPLADEARWLTLGHVLKVTEGRPFVQLKVAVGSDGLIPAGNGAPMWVTGPAARALVHLRRAEADAIATGRGTIEADNPELNCRLPGMAGRSPLRVVFDSRARMSPDVRLFDAVRQAPILVFHGPAAPAERISRLEGRGARCAGAPADGEGRIDLHAALRQLSERGITRLLVEGGPKLAGAFLKAGLVDEALVFEGSVPAGAGGLAPFAGEVLGDAFVVYETRDICGDRLRVFRRKSLLLSLPPSWPATAGQPSKMVHIPVRDMNEGEG